MLGHAWELEAVVVQLGDGDLIVLWRVADGDLLDLEQVLLALEDLLQKRRGDHGVRRHVVLQLLLQVRVEGALAGEVAHQVVDGHLSLDLLDLAQFGHI